MPKLFSLRTRNFCAKITDSRARECRQPVRPTALADPPALSSVHSNFKLKFGVKPPIQRRINTMLSLSSVILWEIFDKSQICLICLHTTFSRLQNSSHVRNSACLSNTLRAKLLSSTGKGATSLERCGSVPKSLRIKSSDTVSLNQAMTLYLPNFTSQIVAESSASNCDLCVESALRTNARTLLGVKDGALAE